jgi:hypothetical protein
MYVDNGTIKKLKFYTYMYYNNVIIITQLLVLLLKSINFVSCWLTIVLAFVYFFAVRLPLAGLYNQ